VRNAEVCVVALSLSRPARRRCSPLGGPPPLLPPLPPGCFTLRAELRAVPVSSPELHGKALGLLLAESPDVVVQVERGGR